MSTPTNPNLGTIASSVTSSFTQLAKLVIASAYLAGLGFSIGAIVKFKEHTDNPTQIPLGTPFCAGGGLCGADVPARGDGETDVGVMLLS